MMLKKTKITERYDISLNTPFTIDKFKDRLCNETTKFMPASVWTKIKSEGLMLLWCSGSVQCEKEAAMALQLQRIANFLALFHILVLFVFR